MDIERWLEFAALSAEEIVRGPLGAASTTWKRVGDADLPQDLWGVYIPLISEDESVQLGLLAPSAVCGRLAKALLGMSEDESFDNEDDVFDAVGEITNMVAGEMKARLVAHTAVSLGLPLAIQGKVFPASGTRSTQGILGVDGSEMWLVVTAGPRRRDE